MVKNPEHVLRVIYGKVLRALQKIPPNVAYRKYTEEIIKTRLQVVIDVSKLSLDRGCDAGQNLY